MGRHSTNKCHMAAGGGEMWTMEEQDSYRASLGINFQPGAVRHFMTEILETAELPDSWIAKR